MKSHFNFKAFFILLIGVSVLVGCKRGINFTYNGKPKETISLERAQAMYQAYQPRFDAVTRFREGREDARYGWHSLDFYKNYIAYLEDEAGKSNIKVSGLRLYYVAYPDDEQSGDQRDYQTYIFVPTYYNETEKKHIAFDPLFIGDDGKPLPIHEMLTKGGRLKSSTMSSSIMMVAAESSSIANMGEMCKPNCQ